MHGTGGPLGRFSHEVPAQAREDARRVADVVRSANRILVLGHTGADGDVCGSSLGLAQALRELGKDVVVYNEEPYPEAYRWLIGGDNVVTQLERDATFDATVVVDAARPDRLGRDFPSASRRGTYVWIDHHRIAHPPGDIAYVDLTACAVGEQIAEILDALGHAISAEVARCLYASLLADTGGFRYGNTSARAFRLAARLMETGIDAWEMTERIYESQDEARLRLLGRALASLWVSPCGRLGVVEITEDDLASLGARDEHVQGLVNHVRGVKGIEIALLLREAPTGTKIIARSRGNVSLAKVVAPLGALGHKNAASFLVDKPLGDARRLVIDACIAELPPLDDEQRDSLRAVREEREEEQREERADDVTALRQRRQARPAE